MVVFRSSGGCVVSGHLIKGLSIMLPRRNSINKSK